MIHRAPPRSAAVHRVPPRAMTLHHNRSQHATVHHGPAVHRCGPPRSTRVPPRSAVVHRDPPRRATVQHGPPWSAVLPAWSGRAGCTRRWRGGGVYRAVYSPAVGSVQLAAVPVRRKSPNVTLCNTAWGVQEAQSYRPNLTKWTVRVRQLFKQQPTPNHNHKDITNLN